MSVVSMRFSLESYADNSTSQCAVELFMNIGLKLELRSNYMNINFSIKALNVHPMEHRTSGPVSSCHHPEKKDLMFLHCLTKSETDLETISVSHHRTLDDP